MTPERELREALEDAEELRALKKKYQTLVAWTSQETGLSQEEIIETLDKVHEKYINDYYNNLLDGEQTE